MNASEYKKLVKAVGECAAKRGLAWFVANFNEEFRAAVHPARFCLSNMLIWS